MGFFREITCLAKKIASVTTKTLVCLSNFLLLPSSCSAKDASENRKGEGEEKEEEEEAVEEGEKEGSGIRLIFWRIRSCHIINNIFSSSSSSFSSSFSFPS